MPTPIGATLKPGSTRLPVALLGSVLLHLTLLFWGWLPHLNTREPARQITFSATLQPLHKAAPSRPGRVSAREQAKNAKPQREKPPHAPPQREKMRASLGDAAAQTGARQENEPGKAPGQNDGAPGGGLQKEGAEHQDTQSASRSGDDAGAAAIDAANVPVYPAEASGRGLESCVLAAVQVSASGEVEAVRILHADVANIFDQSVIDAQSAIRYLPARRNGETLPSRILAVVSFTLEPGRNLGCARQYAGAARTINALPAAAEISAAMLEGAIGKR